MNCLFFIWSNQSNFVHVLSYALTSVRQVQVVCPGWGPTPGTPWRGPQDVGVGAGLTFLGLGVSQGGTPKDPEKTGWVGLDFYRRKDGVPPRGPRGRDPEISGSGRV